uniref:C2H2-type domain-containing protein n=1 Tax=Pelusios castaneus TaxID=367368 RepID=A0A8C8RVT0_9SAUR
MVRANGGRQEARPHPFLPQPSLPPAAILQPRSGTRQAASPPAKPYTCSFCPKHFKRSSDRRDHERVHTGERPYCCRVCGKRFTQSSVLTGHMRIHTGERPFRCPICAKTFNNCSNFKKHQRIHTLQYICFVCSKRFKRAMDLKEHLRVHTGERPFGCEVCGKRFTQSSALATHQRIHTGERPFQCPLCLKRFNNSSSFAKHRRVHSGEHSHHCTLCGKSFQERRRLVRHLRAMHPLLGASHLVNWTPANKMHFSMAKCSNLETKNDLGCTYRMGDSILRSRDSVKDLGIMEDNQPNMSFQSHVVAKRANVILGCINRNLKSKQRGYFTFLFGPGVTSAGILCSVLKAKIQGR